ncbi:peptidylprolyl isomerase [Segatella bryantii]|uniref:Peptidylprolyl isomerase n=1 Tax=Segatella bryantii TaxID=77095 RepID=A0ABX4EJG6_SEGBR|nr:peptidylprolyl isomerase [Segatella bryantii]MDR4929709.1 SurA N-terminal domain-containing protein [Segatella bryantii]OYP56394.1 peptidylprolyl isomerase [Segatella bryantii]UKK80438.1 SurA N-terminal domain-containing protein [Segatella bryantii]
MAALGTIRKRGVILICIIGFGLFAFIAEEAFRSCESSKNDQRQQVGEVLGEKISVTDFQKLVDEYTEVIKMQQGTDNLPEEQMNQVKDMVWNTYVQSKLVENEAKELGLTVTDGELQNILNEGTNPMLLQTPFVNQQTGRFDASSLKKFLADYKSNQSAQNPQMAEQYQKIYNYWTFIEKTLRQQTLAQKYQNLLAHCFISNPVEAKMAFKEENEESSIQLASFPYSDIQDAKIKVEESDMKAKYEELKARFKQAIESRDVKYIDVQVKASSSDRLALQKQFADFQKKLAAAEDPTEILHKSGTSVNYLGIPVAKDAFPTDIAAQLDSMAVGSTSAVKANAQDNTLNIIKLIAKQELPDSIQFRAIQVSGATPEAAHKTADSIYTALQGGAEFEALAKKYGQTGEKTWMTTKQYQFAPSMDKDTKTYISALNNAAVNSYENIALGQGNVILQVVDKKGMINKYTAAVIKKTIDFSQDTYRAAYNKISSFVSANQNGEDLLKNAAKNGYTVQEANDMTTSLHYVANIHSTRDALKWVFDADEKEESPLYECGDNDHLLVMVLNKIHRAGYRDLSDPQVREMVKAEVIKDKKAEQIIAKVKGVKSIAAAKAKGAKVAPVNQVTFAAPVFIASVGASEPALSGAVSATAKGKFVSHPVKGNAGVYLFQVTNKTNRPVKFDEKAMEQKLRQRAMQYAGNFMNELYLNAKVVDNRYLFF